jgi:hypothetical protein
LFARPQSPVGSELAGDLAGERINVSARPNARNVAVGRRAVRVVR